MWIDHTSKGFNGKIPHLSRWCISLVNPARKMPKKKHPHSRTCRYETCSYDHRKLKLISADIGTNGSLGPFGLLGFNWRSNKHFVSWMTVIQVLPSTEWITLCGFFCYICFQWLQNNTVMFCRFLPPTMPFRSFLFAPVRIWSAPPQIENSRGWEKH